MKRLSILFVAIFGIFAINMACGNGDTVKDEKVSATEKTVVSDAGQHECKHEVKPEVCPKEHHVEAATPDAGTADTAAPKDEKVTPEKENIPTCQAHVDLRNSKLPCMCWGSVLRDPAKDMPACAAPSKIECCPGRKMLVCE